MTRELSGQRVLVTGGWGFIGSNLANHLAERNEVVAIDDGSLGTPSNLTDAVDRRQVDVLDSALPTDVDVVYHFAARSSYRMHEADLRDGARVNVEGFLNAVEQARLDGCDTVVYASTSSVYGDRTEPTTESLPVTARTGYEASKLARERYAEYFSTHHGMSMAGARLFSVYQGYEGSEAHKGEYANVVSQFADDIARGRAPRIYGDGSQTRDFVHVDDAVRALELMGLERLDGVYNVGTGSARSFNEVVRAIGATLGREVTPEYVENPIPESAYVHDTCADPRRLRRETGWEPAVDFDDGVRRVCEPYLESVADEQ